jgi:hypothetical protein
MGMTVQCSASVDDIIKPFKLQALFSIFIINVRSNIKSRENHNGFPALFFYPDGERRLAKWTDIRT